MSGNNVPESRPSHDSVYRGETPEKTHFLLQDLLHRYLSRVSEKCALKPELVLKTWPIVVGPQIAAMTRAVRFDAGILYVVVKNSTLLSLLSSGHDKKRLIQGIAVRLPGIQVRDLVFRFG